MALIAAKCTNCGAALSVDNTKEAGICNFCNTAFITEKVVNNYVTNLNKTENITQHITKNIYAQEGKRSVDDMYEDVENLFRGGFYSTVIWGYMRIARESPLTGADWERVIEALKLLIWNGDAEGLVSEIKQKRFSTFYKSLQKHVTPQKAAEVKAEFDQLINLDNSALWERLINKSLLEIESSGYDTLEEFAEAFVEDVEWAVEEEELPKKVGDKIINQFKKHLPKELPEKPEPEEDDSLF